MVFQFFCLKKELIQKLKLYNLKKNDLKKFFYFPPKNRGLQKSVFPKKSKLLKITILQNQKRFENKIQKNTFSKNMDFFKDFLFTKIDIFKIL